jgi:hypothetical protein
MIKARMKHLVFDLFNSSLGVHSKKFAPVVCSSAEGARRTAERLALNSTGVVAFSVTADRETGDCDDEPKVFFRTGELPAEFDLMP